MGYVVTRVAQQRGHIVDLLTLPGRLDVAEGLVEDVLQQLAARGVSGVWCWSVWGHPYAGVVRRAGFSNSRRSTGLKYQPKYLTAEEQVLFDDPSAGIHLMGGDSNIV